MSLRFNPFQPLSLDGLSVGMDNPNNCTIMNMMPMYFDASADVGALLFKEWQVKTGWMYAIAILVMFFASIFNQFLFFIVKRKVTYREPNAYEPIDKNEKLKVIAWYIIKPTVFLFQNALSYLLMLAVMTFNVGIFLAVIVGNTIGWAIFSMRSGITPEESCH